MSAPLALVTGAPGWLATRLIQALVHGLEDCPRLAHSPGRQIRVLTQPVLYRAPDTTPEPRTEVVHGDLTSAPSLVPLMKDAEGATIFHCAGIVHPKYSVRQFYDVNVEGTRNLLKAARVGRVRRFIFVSSNSPVGSNPEPADVFDESSTLRPYMNYGRSKKLAEDLVNEAGANGWFETVIIRPCWFYGPNQPQRQTLFFDMIRTGTVPVVGSGLNRRSMSYIDNVCQGLMLCEQVSAANGRTYWIADHRPYTMLEIIETIERLMEREFQIPVAHKRLYLPDAASTIALGVDALLQGAGLYHQKIHVLSEMNRTIACSVTTAIQELGYDPKIELEEGMRRSIASMLGRSRTQDLAAVASG